jgi:hypothetical protein
MHKTTILKRNLNKWTKTFMNTATTKLLKSMREASDPQELRMYANDLADIYAVCHLIKNGNYTTAEEFYYELDTQVRDMFPTRLVNGVSKMDNYLWELHQEK